MNVKELIKKLKKFDANLTVAGMDSEMGEYGIDSVELHKVSSGNVSYFSRDMKAEDVIVLLH